jgi:hypothetical protein
MNSLRIAADQIRKDEVLRLLNVGKPVLTNDNFRIVLPPDRNSGELYSHFTDDFIKFADTVASADTSHSILLVSFDAVTEVFTTITNLHDPSISIKQIHEDCVEGRLAECAKRFQGPISARVRYVIQHLPEDQFLEGWNSDLVNECANKMIIRFEQELETHHGNIVALNQSGIERHKENIRRTAQSTGEKAYVECFVQKVLPMRLQTILQPLKSRLPEPEDSPSRQALAYFLLIERTTQGFRELIARECRQAIDMIDKIGISVSDNSEYRAKIAKLQQDIKLEISAIELSIDNGKQGRKQNRELGKCSVKDCNRVDKLRSCHRN